MAQAQQVKVGLFGVINAAPETRLKGGVLAGLTIIDALVYSRDHLLAVKSRAKSDSSLKIAAVIAKIARAAAKLQELLPRSVDW